MECNKKSNLKKNENPVAVYLKRKQMKTLEELAFQALIRHIKRLCSELKMANLSCLNSKLKSLSFAEHESLCALPLLEELALFAFDTLDYRLTQKVLNDTVKFFQSFKNVTAAENIKSKFLNAVKVKLLYVLPESAIEHDVKNVRVKESRRFIDGDEMVKFLQSVLQEFTRLNVQSSVIDMNTTCLEQLKISFQVLGVRKLSAFIVMYTDMIIKNEKKFNERKFSAVEKLYEGIPEMLCNIINGFLHAGLHKTKNEYVYYVVKQALNEKIPLERYTEMTNLIIEAVSDDIPFATKKKLISLLNPENCSKLSFLNSQLTSLVEIKEFTKLKVLSISDSYFDDVDDIRFLTSLKHLEITATCQSFSDKLSDLRLPNQLEDIILKGYLDNKNILINLLSWIPHLKQLHVSLRFPGGYVYIGQHLKELQELKIKHIDLYPKYRVLFSYLPDGMKKLECNQIRAGWLTYLSSRTIHSLSEVCFQDFICDSPLSSQLSGLDTITLSDSTFDRHDLFINIGKQLTSLTLRRCSSVNLDCIAAHCPNLLNLKIIWCDFEGYDHLNSPQFPQLKMAYISPACESEFCGWCVIAHSAELEEITALRPCSNKCFDNFIDVNPLSHLKKFVTRMNDQSWLTAEQAHKIVEKCKHFKIVKCTEPKKEHTYVSRYGLLGKIKTGFYVSTCEK